MSKIATAHGNGLGLSLTSNILKPLQSKKVVLRTKPLPHEKPREATAIKGLWKRVREVQSVQACTVPSKHVSQTDSPVMSCHLFLNIRSDLVRTTHLVCSKSVPLVFMLRNSRSKPLGFDRPRDVRRPVPPSSRPCIAANLHHYKAR